MAQEPIPEGYPSPSVPRDAAQNLTVGKSPTVQASMPYTDFTAVIDQKPGMAGKLWDHFVNTLRESVPGFMAMGREAIKDTRQVAVMEVFFGHHEHPGEVGAPMNYTQAEVNKEFKEAAEHTVHGPAASEPSINYPETAAFEAQMADYARSYPEHERER